MHHHVCRLLGPLLFPNLVICSPSILRSLFRSILQVTLNSSAAGGGSSVQSGDAPPGTAADRRQPTPNGIAAPAAAAAQLPRIHNLLEYVAWLTSQEDCSGGMQRPLSEELAAVEDAAARMQVTNFSIQRKGKLASFKKKRIFHFKSCNIFKECRGWHSTGVPLLE